MQLFSILKGAKVKLTTHLMHEIIRLRDVEKYTFKQISNEIGIPETTIRDFYNKRSFKKSFWDLYTPEYSVGIKKPYEPSKRLYGKNKTFVITSAQNNTLIHKQFFESLLVLCKHRNAELLISTFIYNKNGFQNGEGGKDIWYDPKIRNFITNERLLLADDLVFCGELNILPTAGVPESGFESYCGNRSGIIPHTKQRMKPLAAPIEYGARHLYTTGAVTRLNYIEQKAGQKAAYHHIFGALIVEVDEDGTSFIRQINASEEDGTFYDLDYFYTPSGYNKSEHIAAINWGDLHLEVVDPLVALNGFGVKFDYNRKTIEQIKTESILDVLKPEIQFASDTADFRVRNHHNINDHHFRFSQFIKNDDSVKSSMKYVADFLNAMTRPFSKIVVVEANHDLALMKWIKTADYKTDPANAVFFLECQLSIYKAIEAGTFKDFHLFKYVLEDLQPELKQKSLKFLKEGESFAVGNIECGYHGHLGINGARGSAKSFKNIGTRVNLNHSHSACIDDGVYQAGTSSKLRLGYNEGSPSSWSHSHIITYKNFKRCILTMKNGKWRRIYDKGSD